MSRSLKDRLSFLAAAIMFSCGDADAFYLRMQEDGLLAKLCRRLVTDHEMTHIVRDWSDATEPETEGRSDYSASRYSGDDLGGYTKEQRTTHPLAILCDNHKERVWYPACSKIIMEKQPKTVLEIGSASGYDIERLANAFPNTKFIAVDFCEQSRHLPQNVDWRKGYALEMLESGLSADVLISFSALCHTRAMEFGRYAKAFNALKFRNVIVSDPVRRGWRPSMGRKHLKKGITGHDYGSVPGYRVDDFRIDGYNFKGERLEFQTAILQLSVPGAKQ